MARIAWMLLLWLNVVSMATGRPLRADLNGDCRVDMQDLMILLSEWMMEDEDCLMGLGPELVLHGDFEDENVNGDWFILRYFDCGEKDAAYYSSDGSLRGEISQNMNGKLEAGKTYLVQFDTEIVTLPGQSCYALLEPMEVGPSFQWDITETGHTEQTISVDYPYGYFRFRCQATEGILSEVHFDNVSVREVLSDAGGEDSNQSQILLGL